MRQACAHRVSGDDIAIGGLKRKRLIRLQHGHLTKRRELNHHARQRYCMTLVIKRVNDFIALLQCQGRAVSPLAAMRRLLTVSSSMRRWLSGCVMGMRRLSAIDTNQATTLANWYSPPYRHRLCRQFPIALTARRHDRKYLFNQRLDQGLW